MNPSTYNPSFNILLKNADHTESLGQPFSLSLDDITEWTQQDVEGFAIQDQALGCLALDLECDPGGWTSTKAFITQNLGL